MKKENFIDSFTTSIVTALFLWIASFAIALLVEVFWNNSVAQIFAGVGPITYWQAFCLYWLIRFLSPVYTPITGK